MEAEKQQKTEQQLRREKQHQDYCASLKINLTTTLDEINKLNKQLLQIDATATRTALKAAADALRPMLYMLRTVEENDNQRRIDSYT
jgi:antirestriction protein ArdC